MQAAAGPAGAAAPRAALLLALCLLLSVVVGARGGPPATAAARLRVTTSPGGGASRTASRTVRPLTVNLTASVPRIVGGRDAKPGEFPYQVSVRYGGSHFCGGAVLNATTVVTAAHCVYQRPQAFIEAMSVMAGSILQSRPGTVAAVRDVLIHPDYGFVYQEYDIALLYLAEALPLGGDISPVELSEFDLPAGSMCVASGWGRTVDREGSPLPDTLQAVDLPLIDAASCNDMYAEDVDYSPVIESQICAGYEQGLRDSCQGDSGGPLVCTSRRLLTGIVSWGAGCAVPRFPGVYSDVAFLLPWIKENVALDGGDGASSPPGPAVSSTPRTSGAASSVWALPVVYGLAVAALAA